jgi:hypothetical protein
MSINDGGPVFGGKRTELKPDAIQRGARGERTYEGLSLRDWFAGQALVALGDHKAVTARGIPWLTSHAYMVADSMITEREKEPSR